MACHCKSKSSLLTPAIHACMTILQSGFVHRNDVSSRLVDNTQLDTSVVTTGHDAK